MKRLIIFFSFVFFILSICAVFYYFNILNSNKNNKQNTTYDTRVNEKYFDKDNSIIKDSLFNYILLYNDYDDMPITTHYRDKHTLSIVEEFGLTDYDYRNNASYSNYKDLFLELINDNMIRIDCEVYKHLGDDPIVYSSMFLKYYLDINGYLDDLEFLNVVKYREDDGKIISKPNSIDFSDRHLFSVNDIECLIYGLDFIKYKINIIHNEYYEKEITLEIIENKFNEYAMTEKIRGIYSKDKGLIPIKIINNAKSNQYDIQVLYEKTNGLPNDKNNRVGIILVYVPHNEELKNYKYEKNLNISDGMHYYYDLVYSLTDDGYLDDIRLIEK